MESKQDAPKMKKKRWTTFPLTDIDRLIRSSAYLSKNKECVDKEVLVLVSKASELFIEKFTQDCVAVAKTSPDGKYDSLEYKHFVELVHTEGGQYNFLKPIVPKKITVREYRELMAKKEAEQKNKEENY